jgi:pilus assembly protein CpaD
MRHFLSASPLKLLAIAAALAVGACQSPFNGADDAWSAQSAHPITVSTKMVSERFHVGPDEFTLRQDDRDKVASLAADYRNRGVGKLTITAPQGSPNAAVAVQISAEMTNIARDAGIAVRDVDVAGYHAAYGDTEAPIIVSYTVYDATASACGNWTTNYAFAPHNFVTPDHGCATQNNLAAMVENPRDLVTPRTMTAADQGRRQVTLDKYRKGEVTASQKDEQASGAASEVKK